MRSRLLFKAEFNPDLTVMREDEGFVPDLGIGSRFCVKARGKHSRRLEGRTGTIVGYGHTRNALRVLLDGQKSPQTLHRSYLQPMVENCPETLLSAPIQREQHPQLDSIGAMRSTIRSNP